MFSVKTMGIGEGMVLLAKYSELPRRSVLLAKYSELPRRSGV